jgi:hypothetical protein
MRRPLQLMFIVRYGVTNEIWRRNSNILRRAGEQATYICMRSHLIFLWIYVCLVFVVGSSHSHTPIKYRCLINQITPTYVMWWLLWIGGLSMSNIKQSLLSKLDNNEKCVTMRLDYGWRTEENLTRFIILSVCVFFLFLFLFLNRRRCLTTRLVFPSNIETIS